VRLLVSRDQTGQQYSNIGRTYVQKSDMQTQITAHEENKR